MADTRIHIANLPLQKNGSVIPERACVDKNQGVGVEPGGPTRAVLDAQDSQNPARLGVPAVSSPAISSQDAQTTSRLGSALVARPSMEENGDSRGKCLAVSPEGLQLSIPKELFTALTDFMQTRKGPGSITIQFRSGEIICVEAVSKKTYRNP